MKNHSIHLICNAHLDPVWLWEWEEGAAEAISTFRTAADFCENNDAFVFNHNEVILYEWVEEYDPTLFKRIQKLVKANKWHIMGAWYLQPDCNMPSGESFVRQILLGRRYFSEKFGAEPRTAINFDPFGHTRGLVQILAKSGYDSYLFCRPAPHECELTGEEFIWEGYDGSQVMATRLFDSYLSGRGDARKKVEAFIKNRPESSLGAIAWGVGNHGGGPSKIDLAELSDLIKEKAGEIEITHSTPENYFSELKKLKAKLPLHSKDLNPFAVGCYTSQIRLKQKHRKLENELFATEKMLSLAWAQGLLAYPQKELCEVMRDLAHSEFHDILPGSSIQPVENTSLRLMDHGLEILSRLKARSFFALASGQVKAKENETPILVYNPHPYPISQIVECEFQLADANWKDSYTDVQVYANGKKIPTQVEKEASNLNLDWRKKVVFDAKLAPSQMNRFDCRLFVRPEKNKPGLRSKNGGIHFQNGQIELIINTRTGLIDKYTVNGVDYLEENAARALVLKDDADAWGMRIKRFPRKSEFFKLMNAEESARYSGVKLKKLAPVRVIEDGPVRTVVEATFRYRDSYICQHYLLPKNGTEIGLKVRVNWSEKDKILKLSLPTRLKSSRYLGQVAFAREEFPNNGDEVVAQKWVAAVDGKNAFSVVNDSIYGSDCKNGEIRLSLLRSPAYSGHPILDRELVPQDRFTARIDQGERIFNFAFNAGDEMKRLAEIETEALVQNERAMPLSFFPNGSGKKIAAGVEISNKTIIMSAAKKAEDSDELILRLVNPTPQKRQCVLKINFNKFQRKIPFKPFEIKTFSCNPKKRSWREVSLMENK